MSYQATVHRIMIASPSDVSSERETIREVINEWNVVYSESRKLALLPVSWETHSTPEMGSPPQKIINKQLLKNCDLLIGVFWTRIGTPTNDSLSGTVEEIEEFIKSGRPVMLYFSNAPSPPDTIDPDQYRLLNEFKEACKTQSLYASYTTVSDFKDKFSRQLQIKFNSMNIAAQRGDANPVVESNKNQINTAIPRLSTEAKELLTNAAQDTQGRILRIPYMGRIVIKSNGQSFTKEDSDPHAVALWESAIKELERTIFIEATDHERKIFKITNEGYGMASQEKD